MQKTLTLDSHVPFLKAIGHESRTLLNGITGPIQLIRSISDDPNMLDPLKILDLSVTRLDKFSFRTLLLADLLSNSKQQIQKTFDLVDVLKHILLELNEFLDFNQIRVIQKNDTNTINVSSDYELLYNSMVILIERSISLSDEASEISIDFINDTHPGFNLSCMDNGFLAEILKKTINSSTNPTDIDLFLFKVCLDLLRIDLDLNTENGKSLISYKMNS